MGLHLLHLTSGLLHGVPREKTTRRCLIYWRSCVSGQPGSFLVARLHASSWNICYIWFYCLPAHRFPLSLGVFQQPPSRKSWNRFVADSLRARRQQLAQGDQFRLERGVRAASSPHFFLYCWGAAAVYLDPMSGACRGSWQARLHRLWIPE